MIHWEYKKVSPPKAVESQEPDKANEQLSYYPFAVGQWVKTLGDTTQPGHNEDTLKPVDLNAFDRTKQGVAAGADGLSEQAIRGAVSGSSAIPGLSK